jgi:hypothetical protein
VKVIQPQLIGKGADRVQRVEVHLPVVEGYIRQFILDFVIYKFRHKEDKRKDREHKEGKKKKEKEKKEKHKSSHRSPSAKKEKLIKSERRSSEREKVI